MKSGGEVSSRRTRRLKVNQDSSAPSLQRHAWVRSAERQEEECEVNDVASYCKYIPIFFPRLYRVHVIITHTVERWARGTWMVVCRDAPCIFLKLALMSNMSTSLLDTIILIRASSSVPARWTQNHIQRVEIITPSSKYAHQQNHKE